MASSHHAAAVAAAAARRPRSFSHINGALTLRRAHRKLRWDDEFLYVGAFLEEPDVWATLTEQASTARSGHHRRMGCCGEEQPSHRAGDDRIGRRGTPGARCIMLSPPPSHPVKLLLTS
jgi:hypothetical protein